MLTISDYVHIFELKSPKDVCATIMKTFGPTPRQQVAPKEFHMEHTGAQLKLSVVGDTTVSPYPVYLAVNMEKYTMSAGDMLSSVGRELTPSFLQQKEPDVYYVANQQLTGWLKITKDKLPFRTRWSHSCGLFEIYIDQSMPNAEQEMQVDPEAMKEFILNYGLLLASVAEDWAEEYRNYFYSWGAHAVTANLDTETGPTPIAIVVRSNVAVEYLENQHKWRYIKEVLDAGFANLTQHSEFIPMAQQVTLNYTSDEVAQLIMTLPQAYDLLCDAYAQYGDEMLQTTRFAVLHPIDTRGYFLRTVASTAHNVIPPAAKMTYQFPVWLKKNDEYIEFSSYATVTPVEELPPVHHVGTLWGYDVYAQNDSRDLYNASQLAWLVKLILRHCAPVETESQLLCIGFQELIMGLDLDTLFMPSIVSSLKAAKDTRISELVIDQQRSQPPAEVEVCVPGINTQALFLREDKKWVAVENRMKPSLVWSSGPIIGAQVLVDMINQLHEVFATFETLCVADVASYPPEIVEGYSAPRPFKDIVPLPVPQECVLMAGDAGYLDFDLHWYPLANVDKNSSVAVSLKTDKSVQFTKEDVERILREYIGMFFSFAKYPKTLCTLYAGDDSPMWHICDGMRPNRQQVLMGAHERFVLWDMEHAKWSNSAHASSAFSVELNLPDEPVKLTNLVAALAHIDDAMQMLTAGYSSQHLPDNIIEKFGTPRIMPVLQQGQCSILLHDGYVWYGYSAPQWGVVDVNDTSQFVQVEGVFYVNKLFNMPNKCTQQDLSNLFTGFISTVLAYSFADMPALAWALDNVPGMREQHDYVGNDAYMSVFYPNLGFGRTLVMSGGIASTHTTGQYNQQDTCKCRERVWVSSNTGIHLSDETLCHLLSMVGTFVEEMRTQCADAADKGFLPEGYQHPLQVIESTGPAVLREINTLRLAPPGEAVLPIAISDGTTLCTYTENGWAKCMDPIQAQPMDTFMGYTVLQLSGNHGQAYTPAMLSKLISSTLDTFEKLETNEAKFIYAFEGIRGGC